MTNEAASRPLTPYLGAEARYRDDPTYRAMVDMLTSVIAKLEMTPAEVREAAVYACIRFEHLNMRSIQRFMRQPLSARETDDMRSELDRCEVRARDLARWLSGE